MRGQARTWCFTINNPVALLAPPGHDDHDLDYVLPIAQWEDAKLGVWQLEEGDEGTIHYQGYVEFSKAYRLNRVKALPGMARAHLEVRRGTRLQAAEYCQKEDSRLEGPWYYPDEGTVRAIETHPVRSDLGGACAAVKRGASTQELAEEHPTVYVKFHRGLSALRMALPTPERSPATPVELRYYCGPSGTGKSHRLYEECPPGDEWFWAAKGRWWDGYTGQPGIVFDEFRDDWYTLSYFLRLLDNKPLTVETKGGHVTMLATRFAFSSNIHPKNLYKGCKVPWDSANPLRRRFIQYKPGLELMTEPYVPEGLEEMDEEDDVGDLDDYEGWGGDGAPPPAPVVGDDAGVLFWRGDIQ